MPTTNATTEPKDVIAPSAPVSTDPTPTKPADSVTPAKQVDTKVSAADLLDPSTASAEPDRSGAMLVEPVGGSSYPTAEAMKREADAKQKEMDEKLKKENMEVKKAMDASTVRSAVNPKQESVVHPGALKDEKVKK